VSYMTAEQAAENISRFYGCDSDNNMIIGCRLYYYYYHHYYNVLYDDVDTRGYEIRVGSPASCRVSAYPVLRTNFTASECYSIYKYTVPMQLLLFIMVGTVMAVWLNGIMQTTYAIIIIVVCK